MKSYRVYPSGNSAAPWAIDEGSASTAILVKSFNTNCPVYSSVRPSPDFYNAYPFADSPETGPDHFIGICADLRISGGNVEFVNPAYIPPPLA